MGVATKKSIDMTQGTILKNVIRFAIPLILGNILNFLYHAADLIVVGRFVGSSATASVGATSSLNNLIINLSLGISVGASVTVSKCFGAKDTERVHRSVHTAVALSFVSGIVTMLIGLVFARPLLTLMGTPPTVMDGALLYMRIILIGSAASMVYNFGASILRAVGDTKRPLYILSVSGLINLLLNLILVIFFHMGVAGVAIATAVSNWISAVAVLIFLSRTNDSYKLSLKKLRFYKNEVMDTLKIGIPSCIQGSVVSIAGVVMQSAVNSFGAAAVAGGAAASNIEALFYLVMNAFYQATLTSVSQNYGARNEKRIYRTMAVCAVSVVVAGSILGLLSVVFGRQLLGIYITDSAEAIKFGLIRLTYCSLPYFLCGIMEVLANTLRGTGHSNLGMINSLLGVCGMKILWVEFVLPLKHTPQMLFLSTPVSWIMVIIMNAVGFLAVRKRTMLAMKTQ